jgi:membrane peptidoglycan carboxypeptidase
MYVRGDGRKSLEGYLTPFYGATYPARTWTAIMKSVMDGMEVEDFPPPANVDGDAPTTGHAPYTPPPPKPKKTKSVAPTTAPPPPATSNTPPPPKPSPSATGCPPLQNCSPTPTPTPTPSPAGRLAAPDTYARQE